MNGAFHCAPASGPWLFGHAGVAITIDDPTYYVLHEALHRDRDTRPADTDILEYFCNENEQDRRRMGL
jgi:hypothetical protein